MFGRYAWLLPAVVVSALANGLPERDLRNVEIRHTDYHFSLPEYDRAGWLERRAFLRRQILFSAGLYPLPEKTPLKPEITGRVDRGDYSIENVLLETYPGFFLAGNLYRPIGKPGPLPAVASPHGHWRYGRLTHEALNSVPTRAVNLARQGYVVFAYDMTGYTETRQLPHDFLGGKREELWGVGLLGVQLWNSIRVLDFLESLSGVDPARIAATGASGGATQTLLLAAVDDRVRWSAPVNMVSAYMQGGSVCENAPNLRVDSNNLEIASLAAPRPMLLVSATGDWTKNLPREEFPQIQKIYELMGAPDDVRAVQFDAPHNYHQGSREAVYRFFGERILGDPEPTHFVEKSIAPEFPTDLLALWGRRPPAGAVDQETFIEQRIAEGERQVEALKPTDSASLRKAQTAFRERLRLSILASSPASDDLLSEVVETLPNGEKLAIGRRGKGDRIPAVVLTPKKPRETTRPALIVHPEGSAWVLSSSESRSGLVAGILDRGGAAVGVDVFQTAHATAPREIREAGKNAEKFFTTFNRTDDANRVQDVLTAIAFTRDKFGVEDIHLLCPGEAGLWCVLARALVEGPLELAADLAEFDASSDQAYVDRLFIPHLRRAGGLRGASTLLAGHETLLWNAASNFPADWLEASFRAADASPRLEIRASRPSDDELLERIAPDPRRRR